MRIWFLAGDHGMLGVFNSLQRVHALVSPIAQMFGWQGWTVFWEGEDPAEVWLVPWAIVTYQEKTAPS